MKDNKLIQEWLNQELSPEERLQMDKFVSFTKKLEIPTKKTKEEAWNDLLTKINSESTDNERVIQSTNPKNKGWYWVAAALITLLAIFSYLNQSDELIILETSAGELTSITLPDNSSAQLNAESILSYNEKGFNNNRTVTLSGEAFFKVTSGEEFQVLGENTEIKVLGTSFNVFNRGSNFRVSVFTGKVEVSTKETKVLITPGEEAILDKGRLEVRPFDVNETATWREGSFYFDGQPLSEVIEELQRQFDIEIETKTDISQRFYSGYFSKANLTEALQLVFVPMGLSFRTNGNQVTIE